VRLRRGPAAALAVLALLFGGGTATGADSEVETKLQAAFILQFTKFVDWPGLAPDSPFVITVLDDKSLHDRIAEMTKGKRVKGRPLALQDGLEAKPGQLVVVKSEQAEPVLRKLKGCRCLTVTYRAPALTDPPGISVMRAARQHRPATPLFLLADGAGDEPLVDAPDRKLLGVRKAIRKPVTPEAIVAFAFPAAPFRPEEVVAASRKLRQHGLDAEVDESDGSFFSIPIGAFLSGSRSLFDVYIRLGPDRYVKILHAGDAVDPGRVSAYAAKGVTHLYLRRELREQYLAYSDQLATSLARTDRVPGAVRARQVMHFGEETARFLGERGISEANLKYATDYVTSARKVADAVSAEAPKVMREFLGDLRHAEHGAGTAMAAALILKELGFESDGAIEIAGLAALLHDIGLFRMSEEAQSEDPSAMSHPARDEFRTHPAKSADVLRNVPRVHPTVVQAVLQHHERRNDQGFPGKVGAGGATESRKSSASPTTSRGSSGRAPSSPSTRSRRS
jgi:hypothetical protein